MKRLDVKKWNETRKQLESEIVKLKEQIQSPGHMKTSDEHRALLGAQVEATALYMLRAELRDRLHATHIMEYCEDPLQPGTGITVPVEIEMTRGMQQDFIAMIIDADSFMKEVPETTEKIQRLADMQVLTEEQARDLTAPGAFQKLAETFKKMVGME